MAIYKRKFKDRKTGQIVESENWSISYYFEEKQIRETIKGTNKQIAKDALSTKRSEIAQGKYHLKADKKNPLFEQYSQKYLEYSKTNKRSYERDVSIFKALSKSFSGYKLCKITPFLIEKQAQR